MANMASTGRDATVCVRIKFGCRADNGDCGEYRIVNASGARSFHWETTWSTEAQDATGRATRTWCRESEETDDARQVGHGLESTRTIFRGYWAEGRVGGESTGRRVFGKGRVFEESRGAERCSL